MPYLCQLSYISRPVLSSPRASLPRLADSIARQAAPKNAAAGISGRLVALPDAFVQICEGPRTELTDLLRCLLNDDRHADMVIVNFSALRTREFGSWAFSLSSQETNCLFDGLTYADLVRMRPSELHRRMNKTEPDLKVSIARSFYDRGDLVAK